MALYSILQVIIPKPKFGPNLNWTCTRLRYIQQLQFLCLFALKLTMILMDIEEKI